MISSKPSQYIKGWVEFYKQSLKNSTKDIPTAYKKAYVEFYKLKFKVTPDVLIPRPETELLVDEVLKFISELPTITILDLGTGSGNIAISIAKNINPAGSTHSTRGVKLIATDVSGKALKVAKQNAKLHGVEDKITFLQSDLLDVIASEAKQSSLEKNSTQIASSSTTPRNDTGVDIIVTNLPYIPSARIPYLDCSVKDFEPHVALDGGEDGFELYRKLFQQIQEKNWKPKLIIGEIDYTHGELAAIEAQKYFPEARVEIKTDLAHKQRILTIILVPPSL